MKPLLEIRNLMKSYTITSVIFRRARGNIAAVDGVDLDIFPDETLGLVGESGCGKTTLSKLILALEKADDGKIFFDGINVVDARGDSLARIRKGIQVVFQDPFGSLNPRRRIRSIIEEPMIIHRQDNAARRLERTTELLRMVGLNADMLNRYPHEFSGGQRQRICIARALSVHPRLLICDEPVSALDVSIQAQVINLLVELQKKLHLACLFISHNLSVVGYISHRIAVMYKGRIVELAPSEVLFSDPLHPYTKCLMDAVPEPRVNDFHGQGFVKKDEGTKPVPSHACPCSSWCPGLEEKCISVSPVLEDVGNGHFVACHRPGSA
jgi:oligopeptide/dipeptide ABC transporter ATP-binding protein